MSIVTMYRCVAALSGEDEQGNAIMNRLFDGDEYAVFDTLVSQPHYYFMADDVQEESFLLDDEGDDYFDHVLTSGEYRMGWDTDPEGSDMVILEKVYTFTLEETNGLES